MDREQQFEFQSLTDRARAQLRAGEWNLRLSVFPSLHTNPQSIGIRKSSRSIRLVWRRWRCDLDAEKLCTPVERLRHPQTFDPTINQHELNLDEAVWSGITERTQALVITANPAEAHIGLDGTSFEFAVSAAFQSCELHWWEATPSAWRPAMDLFSDMWSTLSRDLPLLDSDRITSFPWNS